MESVFRFYARGGFVCFFYLCICAFRNPIIIIEFSFNHTHLVSSYPRRSQRTAKKKSTIFRTNKTKNYCENRELCSSSILSTVYYFVPRASQTVPPCAMNRFLGSRKTKKKWQKNRETQELLGERTPESVISYMWNEVSSLACVWWQNTYVLHEKKTQRHRQW